jgi:hypothetical protein
MTETVKLYDVSSMHPLTREELQVLSAAGPEELPFDMVERVRVDRSEVIYSFRDISQWRTIEKEGFPTKSFEVDRSGVIRHKGTKRILEVKFDIDQSAYRANLTINGRDYSLDGAALAGEMWATNDR